ncbi:cell division protein ZapA [Chrysiogenes arsenatis]|uniref:cell division protein ZapA n=1 Tax=Chrysiogenes arsenatis TaxID=309797 RepID=UPI000A046234|nr:cell division protein ZapA [Chrysiogenes arsenatis]
MQIVINGQSYTLRGGDDPYRMEKVARFVDDKFNQVREKVASHTSAEKIAVLVALNIADELFRIKQEAQESESYTRKKTLDILKVIDGNLS